MIGWPNSTGWALRRVLSWNQLKPSSVDVLNKVLRRHVDAAVARDGTGSDSRGGLAVSVVTEEIRRTLCVATLESMSVLAVARSIGDVDSMKVELHSMRGGFALAGDTEARDACARVEAAVIERGAVALNDLWPAFQDAIDRALSRLQD
ncbi:hypothetical protein CFB39_18890 [Burkholderia sp. AU6039]|nr:hypothetical protein CFB39_18890 [Burkholderia sp. AU6039]